MAPVTTSQIDVRFAEVKELGEACKNGDIARVTNLLQRHLDVLDSPDRDTRFPYPESCLWSPPGLAAMNGHEALVKLLLEMGANPVPYEVGAQYHQHTYWDWMNELRERGYNSIAQAIETALQKRYGPLVDEGNIRQAVLDGNIERVQTLIAEKAERVRQVDAVGNTPLHIAVATNNLAMTRLLIESLHEFSARHRDDEAARASPSPPSEGGEGRGEVGPSLISNPRYRESGSLIDARNGDGRTPAVVALFGLHRWWRNDEKREVLDLLLKNGAEYTFLIAATVGDEARVREILDDVTSELTPREGTRPTVPCRPGPPTRRSRANALDPCHRRPLSGAASKGHTGIVRLLLEHGVDPNAKEPVCQGGLSLRDAAGKGFIEVVRLLLEHGAIPEHWVDSSGDALFAAHHGGHKDILQLLYAYGATMELQVYSAAHRIDVIAEVLKLQPSKADEVLPYGWDDNGSEEIACNIMRLAIRYGARFENASAWKLRWTAVKYRKAFRLLQEHGANPDLPLRGIAGDMRTRYKNAEEQLRTIAFLVEECGANLNCRDAEGFTPLARAAGAGYRDIVEYLLAKGAETNPDAPEWAKPLSVASRRGHTEIAALLRQHGA